MICSPPSPDPIHAFTDQALEELCRPPVLPVNPDSPEIPRVLSVPQLAQVLHIGRNAVYTLVRTGRIRCLRIGKHIRIPLSALEDFLSSAQ